MPQLIQFKYGDYTHEAGEVVDMRWEQNPNHTRRGWRDTSLTKVTLFVQLQACDWPSLKAKIDALSEAYSVNEQLFEVLDENGAQTRHVLDPNNALSIRGPRVACFELPTNQMEQMVVQRDFVITLEQLHEACENQIIEFHESFTNTGTCGPMWRSQNIVNGAPRAFEIWPRTTQTIIQEGHSVGFNGWYVDGAVPTPLIDSQYEHLEQRMIEPISPIHLGYSWLYYGLKWRFVFEVPTYLIAYYTGNQPLYTNSYYVPRAGTVPPIAPYG